MSSEQFDADAYAEEVERISRLQFGAVDARFVVFQALAATGVGNE